MKTLNFYVSFFLILFSISVDSYSQQFLDRRIELIMSKMTVEEKIEQLINNGFGGTPTNNRLRIPGFFMDDGPHGLNFNASPGGRSGKTATSFPTGIAMVATWDEKICHEIGLAMGTEFWAFNRNQALGPCIDLSRDSRGGRTAESGGEDSYLSGHIGKSVILGMQKTPVIATVKHFMGEAMQHNRYNIDVIASDRWLMDFSGYNFRVAVQDAGVLSVMNSYNKLNGDKASESKPLLSTILRKRWGYPFFVISDWDGIYNSDKALKAGTDINMGSSKYKDDLYKMLKAGTVSISDIDDAVKNVLRTKILSGLMDYYPTAPESFAKTPEINRVNLLAANKAQILLKNEKVANGNPILPLPKTGIKIALIGPNAEARNLNCGGSSRTFPPYAISIRTGIESLIGNSSVFFAKGCDINSASTDGFEAALELARTADVVVFAGGLDASQEGEFGGNDRKGGSFALPGQQQVLINQLALVNPNIVVVVQSGGVCSLNASINNIKGLVYSFYSGQEAGHAIANVLFGDYNPAGRMPLSMPKSDSDFPEWTEESSRHFERNLDGGYRWLDEHNIKPEFAFGFGLSYTSFEYSNFVAPSSVVAGEPFSVYVDVTNTGSLHGEEVVQLYLGSPSSQAVWMPKKQLRGFKRVAIAPGETKTVRLDFVSDDFYYWNQTRYDILLGNYVLMIGGSSDNLNLSQSLMLTAGANKPDLVVSQVYTMPRYPLKGEKVSFYALIKNQGNAATSTNYNVDFTVNGQKVSTAKNINQVIQPGQVKLIESDTQWDALTSGQTILGSSVQLITGDEWSTTNNSISRDNFEVYEKNIALGKKVTVSSERSNNFGSFIVDGNLGTRWESSWKNNESIIVDLAAIATITNISIAWEAAYAKSYKLEGSLDGLSWDLLKSVTAGQGNVESWSINSVQVRYLRISLLERATQWGFSIYELIVNGTIVSEVPQIKISNVSNKLQLPFAKTIFNASETEDPYVNRNYSYNWVQVDGPLGVVIKNANDAITTAQFYETGTYRFKLIVSNSNVSDSVFFNVDVLPQADKTIDKALFKPAIASSIQNSTYNPDMAVDGDAKTRWSSSRSNGQWWQVDLLEQVQPDSISIVWEAAYSKSFNVQISGDNKSWQTIYTNSDFSGGVSAFNNPLGFVGRYLKVNCITRATEFGNSFFSFTAKASNVQISNNRPIANAGQDVVTNSSNIMLTASLSTDVEGDVLTYKWEQLSGPKAIDFNDINNPQQSVNNLIEGIYFFKLTVDDGRTIDFDVVKVTCQFDVTKINLNQKANGTNSFLVYPNPSKEYIMLKFDNFVYGDIVEISDLQGRVVKRLKLVSDEQIISIVDLPSQMYNVKLVSPKTKDSIMKRFFRL